MIGAKSLSGRNIRASGANLPATQAGDMTAPETFASHKKPLTRGAVQTGHKLIYPFILLQRKRNKELKQVSPYFNFRYEIRTRRFVI